MTRADVSSNTSAGANDPQPPRVVFGAANYWGGPITTGTQHYANCFARRDWRVAYASDQISPLHLFRWRSRAYTADKFRLWLRGGRFDHEGRLFAYNHLTLLPVFNAPVLRSRLAARYALDLSVPNLYRVLERRGFSNPNVIWIDHLIFAGLIDRWRSAHKVYRMADDPRLFPQAYPAPLLDASDRLLREADLIVVTAERLYDRVMNVRREDVVYVPNGVDYDRFSTPGGALPPEYRAIPAPRVVYTGSLEDWFDTEMVEAAAKARPDVSFVIIGPARIRLRQLGRLRNVHLLGKRPYESMPAYLSGAAIGIIPFRRSTLIDAVNPIKLYEYLAAGLPVVSTRWDELERLGLPVSLVGDAAEFIEALDAYLEDRGDEAARRAVARDHSWESRFRRISAYFDNVVHQEVVTSVGS